MTQVLIRLKGSQLIIQPSAAGSICFLPVLAQYFQLSPPGALVSFIHMHKGQGMQPDVRMVI